MVLVVSLVYLGVNPITANAANKLSFIKSADCMVGNEMCYGILGSVSTDKIVGLKSSNTKVLKVKEQRIKGEQEINIAVIAKKAGTSTITFKVKRKNGKTYSFKSVFHVYKYENPLSNCKIGKKSYKDKFNKKQSYDAGAVTGKLQVSVKKGYKLKGLYYCESGTGLEKKIKNGKNISLDADHYLRIDYKNTKKNYSYDIYICGW